MKNLALNLGRNTKCEFNSPETGTEEKSRPLHCQEAKFPCNAPVNSRQAAALFQKLLQKRKREQEERAETRPSFHKLRPKHSQSQENYLEEKHPMKTPANF